METMYYGGSEWKDYYETENQYQKDIEMEWRSREMDTERMFRECNAI